MNKKDKINLSQKLSSLIENLSISQRINFIAENFANIIFTTSLGLEDQLISFFIAKEEKNRKKIKIITLQTGRLFPQTLELIKTTKEQLNINIIEFAPNEKLLNDYIKQYGLNGFYESIKARKACCFVRKIEPLKRALKGADVWITGLRSGQSNIRSNIEFAIYDYEYDLIKFSPLADLTKGKMDEFIKNNNIPINPLHKKNYPSIGCEPCTRAIRNGESERAGRWWWENDDKKECGLHFTPKNSDIFPTDSKIKEIKKMGKL